jgi:hypothetical protein
MNFNTIFQKHNVYQIWVLVVCLDVVFILICPIFFLARMNQQREGGFLVFFCFTL